MMEVKPIVKSAFPERGDWKNTYPKNDIFKVLLIGSNKEHSTSMAKWLAGNEDKVRGIYKSHHKGKTTAFYYTWPRDEEDLHQNTIGIDALCGVVENDKDWEDIKSEINQFSGLSVRLLISNSENGKEFAKQVDAQFMLKKENNATDIVEKLDAMDISEFERLLTMFNKYDENQGGSISIKEMPNIANDLGIDQSTQTFKESILALDTNHDEELDLEEFLQWYKVGRTFALEISKIYQLKSKVDENIAKFLDYKKLLKDMDNPDNLLVKKSTNTIKILLDSEKLSELVTRLHLKFTLGGQKRLDAAKNFLSKFTSEHSYTDDAWVNIAVFTKSLTMQGKELLVHMEKFRGNLVNFAEKNGIEGLSGFLNKFIEFRSFSNDSAANIYMKIKLDIESLMRSALEPLIIIRKWLTDDKNSFDFSMRVFSSECLGELIKNKKTVADLLNKGEVEIEANLLKTRLRTLLSNLNPEWASILGLFQLFFMSSNLNLKFKGPFNEFSNEGSFKFFNNSLEFCEPLIKFIKSNFDPEVLKCFSRMEFTFNLFHMFANIQVYSDTIWN